MADARRDAARSRRPRVFVSHSHADDAFGRRLVADLRRALATHGTEGDDAVWYDTAGGLTGGDAWWRTIVAEIRARPVFLVILSPDAMASRWVNDEIDLAWQQQNEPDESDGPDGKVIIPLLYRPCAVRDDLRLRQHIAFHPPDRYRTALAELLAALGLTERDEHTGSIEAQTQSSVFAGGDRAGVSLADGRAGGQLGEEIRPALPGAITGGASASSRMITGPTIIGTEPEQPWDAMTERGRPHDGQDAGIDRPKPQRAFARPPASSGQPLARRVSARVLGGLLLLLLLLLLPSVVLAIGHAGVALRQGDGAGDAPAGARTAAADATSARAFADARATVIALARIPYTAAVPGPGCDPGRASWSLEGGLAGEVECLPDAMRLVLAGAGPDGGFGAVSFDYAPMIDPQYGFPDRYRVSVDVGAITDGTEAGFSIATTTANQVFDVMVRSDGEWHLRCFSGSATPPPSAIATPYTGVGSVGPSGTYRLTVTIEATVASLAINDRPVASCPVAAPATPQAVFLDASGPAGDGAAGAASADFSHFVMLPLL